MQNLFHSIGVCMLLRATATAAKNVNSTWVDSFSTNTDHFFQGYLLTPSYFWDLKEMDFPEIGQNSAHQSNCIKAIKARCATEPLQRVLNAAARLVLNLRLHDHVTPALQQLHWLPIEYRITYKLCLTMHLVHTNRAPQYLSDCVQTVSRSNGRPGLRSSDTAAYVKPRCRTRLGERSFSFAGPTAWNSLPAHLHQISDTNLFKRCLKTELFRRAYRR